MPSRICFIEMVQVAVLGYRTSARQGLADVTVDKHELGGLFLIQFLMNMSFELSVLLL